MSAGDGIRCPVCGDDTKVLETRPNVGSLRRRRACLRDGCGGRLTTVEISAPTFSKKNAHTVDLVAIPAQESSEFEVVPRRIMTALRELLQADTSLALLDEHW